MIEIKGIDPLGILDAFAACSASRRFSDIKHLGATALCSNGCGRGYRRKCLEIVRHGSSLPYGFDAMLGPGSLTAGDRLPRRSGLTCVVEARKRRDPMSLAEVYEHNFRRNPKAHGHYRAAEAA